MEGHYDLIGPNGEIILPQVWETMIEPDWAVTMHMWPVPEKPPGPPGLPPHLMRPGSRHAHRDVHHPGHRPPPGPPPPLHRGAPAPPGTWRPNMHPGPPGPGGGHPAPVVTIPQGLSRGSSSRRKPEPKGALLGWMIGNNKPKSCEFLCISSNIRNNRANTSTAGKGPKKAEQPACLVM
jgi:hypothetical protein